MPWDRMCVKSVSLNRNYFTNQKRRCLSPPRKVNPRTQSASDKIRALAILLSFLSRAGWVFLVAELSFLLPSPSFLSSIRLKVLYSVVARKKAASDFRPLFNSREPLILLSFLTPSPRLSPPDSLSIFRGSKCLWRRPTRRMKSCRRFLIPSIKSAGSSFSPAISSSIALKYIIVADTLPPPGLLHCVVKPRFTRYAAPS